jgi:hypothetical protein
MDMSSMATKKKPAAAKSPKAAKKKGLPIVVTLEGIARVESLGRQASRPLPNRHVQGDRHRVSGVRQEPRIHGRSAPTLNPQQEKQSHGNPRTTP